MRRQQRWRGRRSVERRCSGVLFEGWGAHLLVWNSGPPQRLALLQPMQMGGLTPAMACACVREQARRRQRVAPTQLCPAAAASSQQAAMHWALHAQHSSAAHQDGAGDGPDAVASDEARSHGGRQQLAACDGRVVVWASAQRLHVQVPAASRHRPAVAAAPRPPHHSAPPTRAVAPLPEQHDAGADAHVDGQPGAQVEGQRHAHGERHKAAPLRTRWEDAGGRGQRRRWESLAGGRGVGGACRSLQPLPPSTAQLGSARLVPWEAADRA